MADDKKYLHNIDAVNNKVMNFLLNPLTTAQRTAVGGLLTPAEQGYTCYDTNLDQQFFWDGTTWITITGGGVWGSITGTITAQTDLITYLSTNYYPLSSNPAGYLTTSAANLLYYPLSSNPAGYLTSETDPVFTAWLATPPNVSIFTNDANYIDLTDLSAGTGISYNNLTGVITNSAPDQTVAFTNGTGISVTGTYPNFTITNTSPSSGGTVTAVTATSPLASSGGTTPDISIQQASGSQAGYLSSTDWTTFNSKEPAIAAGTTSQYWRGDKTWQTFPTIPTVGTWGALNYPTWVSGTPFVTMTAAGTFALDTTSYQPLLTNPVTGTGTATQVAFWDTSSSIAGDSQLYWDNTNKYLGVNVAAPQYNLDVFGSGNVNLDPVNSKFSVRNGMIRIGFDTDPINGNRYLQFTDNADTVEYFLFGADTSGNPLFSMGYRSSFSINSGTNLGSPLVTVLSGGNVGIGNTNPQVKLHVGNGGGSMGFPYEESIVEKNGDTKFGLFTSTNAFTPGIGAGVTLGYTGVTATSGYYPGFEFQHIGSATDLDNYTRYNFIQRDSTGSVVGASQDILNIYASGKVTLNPFIGGTLTTPPVPQLLLGLNTSAYALDIDSALSSRISSLGGGGVQMVTADNDGVLGVQAIPTGSGGIPFGTASGTDTYTATIGTAVAYTNGDAYLVTFTNGNTTGATLNINGIGAATLYENNDGALIGGDIWAGATMLCVYNSTLSGFQCIGTSANALFAYVTNDDSVTITKGQPVYAYSGTGDRMTVKLAYNTSDATSAQTVGVVLSSSIAANQKGIIIMQGLLDGLSILPTATWSDGSPVYLGATAGSITPTKPYAPNHLVYLGTVTTASNGSAGRWYVRVQNGYELDELHNVQAQSPTVNDVLYYFGGSPGQWKTASISTVLGYTPQAQLNGTGFVKASGTTISYDNSTYTVANGAITGGTNLKITYDSKGLVTAGTTAATSDLSDVTAWTDYSSTSTIVGFTAYATKKIQYKKIDANTMIVQFQIESTAGNGTGTAASFTLPVNASSWGTQYFMYHALNNNTTQAAAVCTIAASSNVVNCYPSGSTGANWNTATTRHLQGTIIVNI